MVLTLFLIHRHDQVLSSHYGFVTHDKGRGKRNLWCLPFGQENMDILVKSQVEQIFFQKISLEIIDCLQK